MLPQLFNDLTWKSFILHLDLVTGFFAVVLSIITLATLGSNTKYFKLISFAITFLALFNALFLIGQKCLGAVSTVYDAALILCWFGVTLLALANAKFITGKIKALKS